MLVGLAAVLALTGGAYAVYNAQQDDPVPVNEPQDGINYNPPTDEEKKSTEEHKDSLGDQTSNNDEQHPSTKVKPIITSAGFYDGNVEVSARVPGVFEENGTCILTLTKGSQRVSTSKKAIQNVSEMSCGYMTIPRSKLSSGTYKATVTYKSTALSGTSEPKTITVQ